jgi:hypothetical protein
MVTDVMVWVAIFVAMWIVFSVIWFYEVVGKRPAVKWYDWVLGLPTLIIATIFDMVTPNDDV